MVPVPPPEKSACVADEKRLAAEIIGEAEYAQSRLHPRPGHAFYLHLRDLRTALDSIAGQVRGRLLDYGCGSSPYRPLFPRALYERADYTPSAGIDYVVGDDQAIDAVSESFDFVLSTQVLEHVRRPELYLAECNRVLRPGGTVILSTHGAFEEHGCPYDFRRWTADGLKQEMSSAGFEVERVLKLTTGPRAAAFFFRQYGGMLMPGRRTFAGLLHWFFFRRTERYFARMDRKLDRRHANCTVVDSCQPGHALYIALLAVAVKPG